MAKDMESIRCTLRYMHAPNSERIDVLVCNNICPNDFPGISVNCNNSLNCIECWEKHFSDVVKEKK